MGAKGVTPPAGQVDSHPVHPPASHLTQFTPRHPVSRRKVLLKFQKQCFKESDLMGMNLKTSSIHSGFSFKSSGLIYIH